MINYFVKYKKVIVILLSIFLFLTFYFIYIQKKNNLYEKMLSEEMTNNYNNTLLYLSDLDKYLTDNVTSKGKMTISDVAFYQYQSKNIAHNYERFIQYYSKLDNKDVRHHNKNLYNFIMSFYIDFKNVHQNLRDNSALITKEIPKSLMEKHLILNKIEEQIEIYHNHKNFPSKINKSKASKLIQEINRILHKKNY